MNVGKFVPNQVPYQTGLHPERPKIEFIKGLIQADNPDTKIQCSSDTAECSRINTTGAQWPFLFLIFLFLFIAGCTKSYPGYPGISNREVAEYKRIFQKDTCWADKWRVKCR